MLRLLRRFLPKDIVRPLFEAASVTDRGLLRPENQDHVLARRVTLVFCVADGVGGGDGGAKASEIVCNEMSSAADAVADFSRRIRACDDAARIAHARIADYAIRAGFKRYMGTTMALLVIDPDPPPPGVRWRKAAVAHIGDSRVYRWRKGVLELLTRDHTVAEQLRGDDPDAEPANRKSRLGHMLTRAIGPGDWVAPDWRKVDVRGGDVFLVCSDGVHDMLPDERISAAIAEGGRAKDMVERISKWVRAAGAEDNFTMVVVKARGG